MRVVSTAGHVIAIDGCAPDHVVTIQVTEGELAGGTVKIRPADHVGEGNPVFQLAQAWQGTVTLPDGQ